MDRQGEEVETRVRRRPAQPGLQQHLVDKQLLLRWTQRLPRRGILLARSRTLDAADWPVFVEVVLPSGFSDGFAVGDLLQDEF